MGIIYSATNKINGKMYIGQTINTLEYRKAGHKRSHGCTKFKRAIDKYGWDNFEWKIELECDDSCLDYFERRFIIFYDSINSGYNLKEGGANGKLSEETKRKISESHIGIKPTEETREKLRKNNPKSFLGRKHTDETKALISKNRTGISTNLGRVLSEETKIKIGLANTGKVWNDRQKENLSDIMSKRPFSLINNSGEIVHFKNLRECSEYLKCDLSLVSLLLRGKVKTIVRRQWRLYND